jgi:hypothetical protein
MFDIQELMTKFNPQDIYIYLIIIYMAYVCYSMLLLSMVNDSKKWKFYIYIILIVCSMYTTYHFKYDIQRYISILYKEIKEII